jgi:hypothetical protein
VRVKHDVTVLSGGALIAAYGGTDKMQVGSNLNVLGNVYVRTNGILVLGCEPVNYICFNDPDQKVGSYFTRDTVGGDLIAEDALAVIAHLTVIGQDVRMTGGGGGVSCSGSLPPPQRITRFVDPRLIGLPGRPATRQLLGPRGSAGVSTYIEEGRVSGGPSRTFDLPATL